VKHSLIALPLSTLLILTGCGGSGSGGDDKQTPTPTPAPTVSVTAPANATANTAFDVAWSSTNATSCSSAFSDSTATSGTASVTEMDEGAKTYSVTCTGAGGSATGSASVTIQPLATPEGLWQGSSTGNGGARTLSGVVTKENKFWLVYSGFDGTAGDPAGFFMGSASPSEQTATAGQYNTASGLVEFNFEGVNAGVGSLTATYTAKSAFDGVTLAALPSLRGTQAYTIDGVTTPIVDGGFGATLTQIPNPATFSDGGTPWTIIPNANDLGGPPTLEGTLAFAPYQAIVDLTASSFGTVALTIPNRKLEIDGGTASWDAGTRTLTVTGINFIETSPGTSCDDGGTTFCSAVPGPSDPSHGDIVLTFAVDMINYTGIANVYQNISILAQDGTGICIEEGGANPCANMTLTFSGAVSSGAPVTKTQTFTADYDAAYEGTPALAVLAGDYSGNAGVGNSLETGASFVIDAAGNVTGATTDCTLTAKVAPHSSGNLYDVTDLTFSGASCTLTGETFAGIATVDGDQKITVTAVNANSEKGFLFVGGPAS
jgi:hypothetical protein